MSTLRYMLALVIIGIVSSAAHAMDAETLRKETGWPNGLVAAFGEPDLALDLGKDARHLVVWFSDDPERVRQVRERILAAGLQGVVTADLCAPGMIPLRGELANVVAVDPQTAGKATPSDTEIQRVLIPGGSHYRKSGDTWTGRKKAWPKGYGNWTQVDQGPDGNAVADDQVVSTMRGVQWLGGFGAAHPDPLVLKDTMVVSYDRVAKPYKATSKDKLLPEFAARVRAGKPQRTVDREGPWRAGRDAFNGLPRWIHRWWGRGVYPMALGGEFAVFPRPPKALWGWAIKGDVQIPMHAIDLRTGEISHTFDDAPKLLLPGDKSKRPSLNLRTIDNQISIHNETVYITGVGGIAACDLKTGATRWKIAPEGKMMSLPTVNPDGRRVYCLDADTFPNTLRYFGQRKVRALLCIDAAKGRVLWRKILDPNEVSNLIAVAGGVVVGRMSMHGWNIAAGKPREAKHYGIEFIDLRGEQVWLVQEVDKKPIGKGAQNMLVHGDHVYAAEHYRTVRVELKTGKVEAITTPNIGCQRMFGLADKIGYSNMLFWKWGEDNDFTWTYQGLAHPACGGGVSIANGRFYYRSIDMCDCNFQLRTTVSIHSEDPVAQVDDDQRLTPGHQLVAPVATEPAPRPAEHAGALIREEWHLGYYGPAYGHYSPVIVRRDDSVAGWSATADDMNYVPKVHGQRLEARRGERLVWAQQLGGRPAGTPVLAGGHVIQACRDGYVYAFDPKTGKPQWCFLAARVDHRLVNSGQVESVWPCVGAVLHQDTLAVAAGISPEMDGGGMIWGLDPRTARIQWKIALVTNPIQGEGLDERRRANYAGFHTNGWGYPIQAIKVVEDTIAIGYRRTANFGSHGKTFWAWVGVDPNKEQTVDLAARWRGTDRIWMVFDDGQLLPRNSVLKKNTP